MLYRSILLTLCLTFGALAAPLALPNNPAPSDGNLATEAINYLTQGAGQAFNTDGNGNSASNSGGNDNGDGNGDGNSAGNGNGNGNSAGNGNTIGNIGSVGSW